MRNYCCRALAQPGEQLLNPLLWVGTQQEHRAEHRPHHEQENGESQPTVGNKAVNAACVPVAVLCSGLVSLLQRTVDEAIFRTVDGSLGIHAHLRLYVLGTLLGQRFPPFHLKAVVKVAQCLLVILKQLQRPVSHRELLRQVIGLVHRCRYWRNLLLNDGAVVYVYVAYCVVLALEKLNHRVKQLVEPFVIACHGGYHWNTHHSTQMYIVHLRTFCQQLVIHVQRHNRAYVHVNELCGEVEVALKVRCHYRVYDNVGHLLKEVAAHIYLLGRICRDGVGSRQVGEVYAVALVVEAAGLGIHSHAAVVAHVLVLVGKRVEYRCLAAVGVAHQRNVDDVPPLGGVAVAGAALSIATGAAVAQ